MTRNAIAMIRIGPRSIALWNNIVLLIAGYTCITTTVFSQERVSDHYYDPGTPLRTAILEDALSIRLKNTKPQFLAIFFERRQVMRFATEQELIANTRFILPESLDPPYDHSFVPWEDRHERAFPKWFNVRVDEFSAHRINEDGSREELEVIRSARQAEVRTFLVIANAEHTIHDVQGLQVGDLLEVRWKYMVPYDVNWPVTTGWREHLWIDNWARLTSWRVFFNGSLPIEKQSIELHYDLRHGLELGGTLPDHRDKDGNAVICRWERAGLSGSINEPNARPAVELPHITIRLNSDDTRYWRRDRLSGVPFQQPYWLQVVRTRESRAFWWRRVARKRIPDRQNQLVKEFIRDVAGHLPDSLPQRKLELLQARIAQDFTYERDDLWYREQDRRIQKLGDQIREHRIRDNSRYDLYSKVINTLKFDHSTAYVMDDRVGRMTDRFLSPVWDSEYLFVVRDKDDLLWVHPKRTRYGTFANEFPFYWQGTSALLVDLELMLEDIPPPPLFVDLPQSAPEENVRGTEYSIQMDLEQGTASAGVRVFLSGQFSTLGRGAYLGHPIDSTVDPLYGHRAFDLPGSSNVSWKNGDVEQQKPFRFRGNGTMVLNGDIVATTTEGDELDLSAFIKYVLPEPFSPEDRHQPFYWDFPYADHHRIEIQFDQPVTITNEDEIVLDLSTSNSSYQRNIHILAPDRILLETRLKVDQQKEYPSEMHQLAQLVRKAQEDLILEISRLTPLEGSLEQ